MKKRLQTVIMAAAVAVGLSFSANAESIEGYFRVQSALGSADGSGYVEVRGPLTTAPDVMKQDALTKAGTVMRLRAFPDTYEGKLRYKIGNLSCQGIEVFGAPKADYMDAIMEIAGDININDFEAAAYGLQRRGREIGYISTGRVIVQALFQIVAERLDNEVSKLPQDVKDKLNTGETLGDFAKRFNQEVSANIDLHAYLEPVAENQYRLYFNWIDCAGVSEFYLANEQNKKSFELGFECMRQYMNGKDGLGSGETIDSAEAKLWKQWGYDIDKKYHDCLDESTGIYTLTYEKIFADHEVLYNWLKMYIERFLDPAKAPNAEILGINFKDFAAEMQRHAIMQGFLKYIPSIQEGQKLYLTSGRFSDGVNEFSTVGDMSDGESRFGLLGESQALAAGNAAIWNVLPIDETDNYFAIDAVGHRENKPGEENGHLIAMYVDFPMEPVNADKISFVSMSQPAQIQNTTLDNLGNIEYVVLSDALTTVPRRTAVLIETKTTELADNIVRIPYLPQDGDYDPEVNNETPLPGGFIVSDEEVTEQYAANMPLAMAAGDNAVSYGVLLNTPATETALTHLWGIDTDLSTNSVYDLTTREDKKSAATGETMRTPWFTEAATIPANHAFVISSKDKPEGGISVGAPADEEPEVATSVDEIGVDDMLPDVIYDLQGRKVSTTRPGGIYILNGKKIMIR